jgi:hypothetical protein
VSFILLFSTLSGCSRAINEANAGLDRTLSTLDEGINSLTNESADWRAVLQELVAKLTEETQATIRNEITNLIQRSVAAVGVEVRCNADFIATRVLQALVKIRAKLLGEAVPESQPVFCTPVPTIVERSQIPKAHNHIEFYGYDFDSPTPVQVLLENKAGGSIDVSTALDRPTHYLMTLNLGANGVQIPPGQRRFVIRWKDKELSSIGILDGIPPICNLTTKKVQLGNAEFYPPHTRGDTDFDGNGPRIWVGVRWRLRESRRVDVEISMTAKETQSDYTSVSGLKLLEGVYVAGPNEVIEQIVGKQRSSLTPPFVDTDHETDDLPQGSSGPALRYSIVGDTDGNEAGSKTKVIVIFNPLEVAIYKQLSNCTSPTILNEALKRGDLSPTTQLRLRQALRKVPMKVRNLPPGGTDTTNSTE